MTTLDIYINGSPRTQGSITPVMRKTGGVFMKQTEGLGPWRDTIAWHARAKRPEKIEKPRSVGVVLDFTIEAPKKSRNTFPRGDVDKLSRACLDALTGICWDDDVQVVSLNATKQWGQHPGVRIRVAATP
jgi:crossover junction endodeoxyribonuclease RusA